MKYTNLQAAGWIALYVVLALSPLMLVVAGPAAESRGFWIEFGVGLGFVGLMVMCLQFVITGRFRHLAMGFGSDSLLHFHTAAGVTGMLLILAHPVILLVAEPAFVAYLDPRVNLPRVLALVPATAAVIFLVVLSLFRTAFRLNYEWWRLSHGALAVFVVFVGLVHILQVAHHTSHWWQKAYIILVVALALAAIAHVRVFRPLRMKRRPWEIVSVIPERDDATTLILEARGHDGLHFQAGQYAYLTIGETPFSLQQNPYSFASAAQDPRRLAFTSKPAGDFNATWPHRKIGETAYLEGPFGAFTLPEAPGRKLLFFAGGVGITPMMSMLRTLAVNRDPRAVRLIYANRTWDGVIFREELERLKDQLNLQVHYVLSDPEPGWEGLCGFVTPEIIAEVKPRDLSEYDVYICGPEPMMDLVEREMVGMKELSLRRIMSERFDIV